MKITKTIVGTSDVEVHTEDGKQIIVAFHDNRLHVAVSGLGDDKLTPVQIASNNVDIYHGQVPENLAFAILKRPEQADAHSYRPARRPLGHDPLAHE